VKRKLVIWAFVAVVATIAGSVFVRDTRPVLIRLPFLLNQETGDHNYVLFNPFRDRAPERAAHAYLEAMRRGNCAEAEKLSTNPELPNELTCEQLQNEYRDKRDLRDLFVQRLRDRKETQGDVILYYSNSGAGVEGNWVAVRWSGADWRVVGFNKIW
jgi:hypothetical protein